MTECSICFHRCRLDEGQTGFCRARRNEGGSIVPINYGRLTSLALDPIEKKPLNRFHPGSMILSAGSFGCNMRCPHCQNHSISMAGSEAHTDTVTPEWLAKKAASLTPYGNIGVAYTYNEPLVGYEFVLDAARCVRERGMANVLVTNGLIEEGPWLELLPFIDAANIDLKGFSHEWYRELGGDLDSVKRSIALAARSCHLEVTTLVVPGRNDTVEEIRALARFIAGLDDGIPLHLTRCFPRYRSNIPPTPIPTLQRLSEEAALHLKWVYTGNC